jgi:hypothetical protein
MNTLTLAVALTLALSAVAVTLLASPVFGAPLLSVAALLWWQADDEDDEDLED